jgi:hypothetical protein
MIHTSLRISRARAGNDGTRGIGTRSGHVGPCLDRAWAADHGFEHPEAVEAAARSLPNLLSLLMRHD